jgi:hypothetical protein
MALRQHPTGRLRPCLLGVLLVGLLPARAASAPTIFRNECPGPVVVQAVSVVGGVVLRSPPLLLKPGQVSLPGVILPGNKVITVYDARVPTLVLVRDAVPASPVPLYYSIRPPNPLQVRFHILRHPARPVWAVMPHP